MEARGARRAALGDEEVLVDPTTDSAETLAVPMPALSAEMSFDDASALVVDYLKQAVPLGYWGVTRFDGERQLYLEVRDDVYGLNAGDSRPWADTFCSLMHEGRADRRLRRTRWRSRPMRRPTRPGS